MNYHHLLTIYPLLFQCSLALKAAEDPQKAAMIIGGHDLISVELFGCPGDSQGSQLADLYHSIDEAAGIYLPDEGGYVLLTGGSNDDGNKTWIYNITSNAWRRGPFMNRAHRRHLMIYSEDMKAPIVLGGDSNTTEYYDGQKWQDLVTLANYDNAICFQYHIGEKTVYVVTQELELRVINPLTGDDELIMNNLPEEFLFVEYCTIAQFDGQYGLLLNTGSWFGLSDTTLHNSLEPPKHRLEEGNKRLFTFNGKATIFGSKAKIENGKMFHSENAVHKGILQYDPQQDRWNNLGKLLKDRKVIDTVVEVPVSHCKDTPKVTTNEANVKKSWESNNKANNAIIIVGTWNQKAEIFGCDGEPDPLPLAQFPNRQIWTAGAYDDFGNRVLVCGGLEMHDMDGDNQIETNSCFELQPDHPEGTWNTTFPHLMEERWRHIMVSAFHPEFNRHVPVIGGGNRRPLEYFNGQEWVASKQWATSFMLDLNCVTFSKGDEHLYVVQPTVTGINSHSLFKVDPISGTSTPITEIPQEVEENPFCMVWNDELFFRDGYSMNLETLEWRERQIAPILNNYIHRTRQRNIQLVELKGLPTIINGVDCEEANFMGKRECGNKRIDQYDPDSDTWSTIGHFKHDRGADFFSVDVPQKFCNALLGKSSPELPPQKPSSTEKTSTADLVDKTTNDAVTGVKTSSRGSSTKASPISSSSAMFPNNNVPTTTTTTTTKTTTTTSSSASSCVQQVILLMLTLLLNIYIVWC